MSTTALTPGTVIDPLLLSSREPRVERQHLHTRQGQLADRASGVVDLPLA
ncbi:MAG: hypothetical protein VW708_00805 [Ilumatobacter sp.]